MPTFNGFKHKTVESIVGISQIIQRHHQPTPLKNHRQVHDIFLSPKKALSTRGLLKQKNERIFPGRDINLSPAGLLTILQKKALLLTANFEKAVRET